MRTTENTKEQVTDSARKKVIAPVGDNDSAGRFQYTAHFQEGRDRVTDKVKDICRNDDIKRAVAEGQGFSVRLFQFDGWLEAADCDIEHLTGQIDSRKLGLRRSK